VAVNKRIEIRLSRQKLRAFEGDELFHECDCVTGKPGHETHPRRFSVYRKVADHRSTKYDAPMPCSMFFETDGKAIHGTGFARARSYAFAAGVESVGSHGCVGVSNADARKLYDWAPIHTRVVIRSA
jgi:lipoprotein-anchoring transpeptidase ErfK/SrfK